MGFVFKYGIEVLLIWCIVKICLLICFLMSCFFFINLIFYFLVYGIKNIFLYGKFNI